MWILFSFLSAFLQSSYQVVVKKVSNAYSPNTLSAGYFFIAAPLIIVYIFIFGIPELNINFYLALFVAAIINAVGLFFFYYGLSRVELSASAPILATTPVFALLTGYIILNESPTLSGAVGVLIVVFGLIVLNFKIKKPGDLIETKVEFDRSRKRRMGVVFLFIVAFLWSLGANFDKMVATNSSAIFGSLASCATIGFFMLCVTFFKKERGILLNKNNFKNILLLGILAVFASLVWYSALSLGLVVYTIAIRRLSALFGIFFGYFIFKEKNIKQRIAGAIIILVGIFFIVFFK
jgi:drug/metabolite transporter (DMT)-like permease